MIQRDADPDDAPAIQNLLAQLGYPDLSLDEVRLNMDRHRKDGYRLMVCEEDGRVAGFISLHCFYVAHHVDKIGRISAFCVEERFRSKGVGRQLLHAAEEWLISQGCTKLEVTSNARRVRAHQFYLGLGYVEDSRRFVKYIER